MVIAAVKSTKAKGGCPLGSLPSDVKPDFLAVTLLAVLQGGLLLAQVQPSTKPFETAVDTLLALASPKI